MEIKPQPETLLLAVAEAHQSAASSMGHALTLALSTATSALATKTQLLLQEILMAA